jgi:hypothetical protein
MQDRITRRQVKFLHPFSLAGLEGKRPAGTYAVETTEAPIDGLSFLAYRRVSTTIELSTSLSAMMSRQLVEIDPLDLEAAETRDADLEAAAGASGTRAGA